VEDFFGSSSRLAEILYRIRHLRIKYKTAFKRRSDDLAKFLRIVEYVFGLELFDLKDRLHDLQAENVLSVFADTLEIIGKNHQHRGEECESALYQLDIWDSFFSFIAACKNGRISEEIASLRSLQNRLLVK
jgi:hypothetical protein